MTGLDCMEDEIGSGWDGDGENRTRVEWVEAMRGWCEAELL